MLIDKKIENKVDIIYILIQRHVLLYVKKTSAQEYDSSCSTLHQLWSYRCYQSSAGLFFCTFFRCLLIKHTNFPSRKKPKCASIYRCLLNIRDLKVNDLKKIHGDIDVVLSFPRCNECFHCSFCKGCQKVHRFDLFCAFQLSSCGENVLYFRAQDFAKKVAFLAPLI